MDLKNVRVVASPEALAPYRSRAADFPVGSIVLKEEYDFGDTACAGAIQQWTVMTRLAKGSSPSTLDWRWDRVDTGRHVVARDDTRCIGCHTVCGKPPDGYEGTCAVAP